MRIKINMNLTKKTKIRHRNELNSTLSQLPLAAKRVMYLALAPIDSKNKIESGRVFKINASDLSKMAGIGISLAYQQLKEGAKLLRNSSLCLSGDDVILLSKDLGLPYTEKNKPNEIDLSITDYCAYFNGEGYLEIRFTRSIEPYISNLVGEKNKYTTRLLVSSLKLNGFYSSSLYQLLRKHHFSKKNSSRFIIEINELKQELLAFEINEKGDMAYKYPDFPIFKREVLNKSIKEIKEKTEIKSISISIFEKKGKKAHKILFEYIIEEEKNDSKNNTSDLFKGEEKLFLDELDKSLGI